MGRSRTPFAAGLAELAGAAWQLWAFLRDDPDAPPPRRPAWSAGRGPRSTLALLLAGGAAAATLALLALA